MEKMDIKVQIQQMNLDAYERQIDKVDQMVTEAKKELNGMTALTADWYKQIDHIKTLLDNEITLLTMKAELVEEAKMNEQIKAWQAKLDTLNKKIEDAEQHERGALEEERNKLIDEITESGDLRVVELDWNNMRITTNNNN